MQPTRATTTVHAVFPANPRRPFAAPPPPPAPPSQPAPPTPEDPPARPAPLVLTVTEAAELLGISRAFAYELVARGELPSIRLGRRVVVPRAQLLALVDPAAPRPGAPAA